MKNVDRVGAVMSSNAIPWRRNLILLWIGQLLGFVGYSAAIPFIPYYIKDVLGLSSQEELAKALASFHICSTLCLAIISPVLLHFYQVLPCL